MENKRFEIGDLVRVVSKNRKYGVYVDEEDPSKSMIGKVGTIVGILGSSENKHDYEVKFDKTYTGCHKGLAGNKHRKSVYRFLDDPALELVKRDNMVSAKQRIIIETDGTVTTAKLLNGKSVERTAKCVRNPEDKHDLAFALLLCHDHLFPEAEKTVEKK